MKKPCPVCEGSGQISYFGGESRFITTWEDCPDCLGLGFELTEEEQAEEKDGSEKKTKRRKE